MGDDDSCVLRAVRACAVPAGRLVTSAPLGGALVWAEPDRFHEPFTGIPSWSLAWMTAAREGPWNRHRTRSSAVNGREPRQVTVWPPEARPVAAARPATCWRSVSVTPG